jgi:hypothetical protein
MQRISACLIFSFVFLGLQASTRAQDILVPAGTLLHCTLNEPDLSSATASVGDPVICHLSSLQEFGHVVFPRGSYLGGHLEADKEPGHFFGKGNLKLTFDRVGLPNTDIPVPAKVIAARGYRVNRQGEIVGYGHAKRDTIEWLIPPLWPWKVLTLPARGPRPTLKGEEPLTLRLMDDIVVPRMIAGAGFSERPASIDRLQPSNVAPSYDRSQSSNRPASFDQPKSFNGPGSTFTRISYSPPSTPVTDDRPSVQVALRSQSPAAESNPAGTSNAARLTLIALKSDTIYCVTSYRINGGSMSYVLSNGMNGSVDATEVDWGRTSQLNAERPRLFTPR